MIYRFPLLTWCCWCSCPDISCSVVYWSRDLIKSGLGYNERKCTAHTDSEDVTINSGWGELHACSIYFKRIHHHHQWLYSPCKDLDHLTYWGFVILLRHGRTSLGEWSARRKVLYLHRTTQHINTSDKHPCPQRDSNPRSQHPSGRRPTPLNARPLGSTFKRINTS
jgi:hypothetical protein